MAGAKASRRSSAGRKRKTPSKAETADPHELYVRSVQAPNIDVAFFSKVFRSHFGRTPLRLREDFCGTAAVSCAWVRQGNKRVAWGVDLDASTLDWAREHHLSKLPKSARERVCLEQADVRSAQVLPVDVIAAENFSYFVFKRRAELLQYFRRSWEGLDGEGIFIVDLFGGYESIEDEREETTKFEDFDYVWEQHRFDPINAFGTYKIHFRFSDGSAIEEAFVYEWRMWTLPEVREAMEEAGFDRVIVYWEDEHPETGDGMGTFSPRESADCDPAWNAYVVGVRQRMDGP